MSGDKEKEASGEHKGSKDRARPRRSGVPIRWLIALALAVVILLMIKELRGCAERGAEEQITEVSTAIKQAAEQAVKEIVVGEEGEVHIVTEATLQDIVASTRLYTAEYNYNGYTAVTKEDVVEVKYYVAYEGTVRAGFDAAAVTVELEEETHTVIVRLPEMEIGTPVVDAGSMEYIFMDASYNTETVAREAYSAAVADLERRTRVDQALIATATQTAKTAERAMIEPLLRQIDPETSYTIRVLAYDEAE